MTTIWNINLKKHKCPIVAIPTTIAKIPNMDSTEKLIFGFLLSKYSKLIDSNSNIDKTLLAHMVHTTPNNVLYYLFDLAKSGWIGVAIYGNDQLLVRINNKSCFDFTSNKTKEQN